MNFLQVRNNLAHMLHQDPNGITKPPIDDPDENKEIVNHQSLDLTNPVGSIECDWWGDHVRIFDPEREISFSISYENRTEGEIAAEVTKILDYLS